MKDIASHPIGIFDSGVGGLTVANAVKHYLPLEDIVYFGDTAHLPYGDKSPESIIYYSKCISDFLIEKQCKLILIACNTASAHAYEEVKKHIGNNAFIVNVIDPVVEYVVKNPQINKVAVIGTKGTVKSNTYCQKINELNSEKQVVSLATPLFVPMIEEGFIFDDISNAIIRAYLSKDIFANIDSLILGCTHYPIIKNQIKKFFNFNVEIIDSSQIVAKKVQQILSENHILNTATKTDRFYVSDYTETFEHIAGMFFDNKINLSKIDIWSK